MHLSRIVIENFRNFSKLDVALDHHLPGCSLTVRLQNFGACRLNWGPGTRFGRPPD